jgi:hypothetical protein
MESNASLIQFHPLNLKLVKLQSTGSRMNTRLLLTTAFLCFPLLCGAQEQDVLPLKSEPHHHLVLHNDFVNVYSVQVSPHDSVALHKHDVDAVSIVLGDAVITVKSPGKPDVHQNVMGGQLRLQRSGLVHSTDIEGDAAYRNVTVELLLPQQGGRNLCATVISGEPLNCPDKPTQRDPTRVSEEPQFQSDQTKATLVRIPAGKSAPTGSSALPGLIVALDEGVAISGDSGPGKLLRRGEAWWRNSNSPGQLFTNGVTTEVRLVSFTFKEENPAK